jgi:putative methyltransferase (TIGR04325 family)
MSIKQFIPPILINLLKGSGKYGWKGEYRDWQSAIQASEGYNALNILNKVKEATLKVKNGEAIYERDSVLFDKIEYSWPLLSGLMLIAAKNNSTLKVLDFGGSLGSTYFQNKKFLDELRYVEWNIVEQEGFVPIGRDFIEDEVVRFFYTLTESITERGMPDILITSCTLPYLEQPYKVLEELTRYKIPYLIIDNTPFNRRDNDRICQQKVPDYIYEATLPCWLLSYKEVRSVIEKQYNIMVEYQNDSFIYLDGHKIYYKGLIGSLK